MNKAIQYHKSKINKLNQKLEELSSEEFTKVHDMASKIKFNGERQPLFEWYRGTDGYKQVHHIKRQIRRHRKAIQQLKRPMPKSFFEEEL